MAQLKCTSDFERMRADPRQLPHFKEDLVSGKHLLARVIETWGKDVRRTMYEHYMEQFTNIQSLLTNTNHEKFFLYHGTITNQFNSVAEVRTAEREWMDKKGTKGDHPFVTLWITLINIENLPVANNDGAISFSSDEES